MLDELPPALVLELNRIEAVIAAVASASDPSSIKTSDVLDVLTPCGPTVQWAEVTRVYEGVSQGLQVLVQRFGSEAVAEAFAEAVEQHVPSNAVDSSRSIAVRVNAETLHRVLQQLPSRLFSTATTHMPLGASPTVSAAPLGVDAVVHAALVLEATSIGRVHPALSRALHAVIAEGGGRSRLQLTVSLDEQGGGASKSAQGDGWLTEHGGGATSGDSTQWNVVYDVSAQAHASSPWLLTLREYGNGWCAVVDSSSSPTSSLRTSDASASELSAILAQHDRSDLSFRLVVVVQRDGYEQQTQPSHTVAEGIITLADADEPVSALPLHAVSDVHELLAILGTGEEVDHPALRDLGGLAVADLALSYDLHI